jgi:hypothetical protein
VPYAQKMDKPDKRKLSLASSACWKTNLNLAFTTERNHTLTRLWRNGGALSNAWTVRPYCLGCGRYPLTGWCPHSGRFSRESVERETPNTTKGVQNMDNGKIVSTLHRMRARLFTPEIGCTDEYGVQLIDRAVSACQKNEWDLRARLEALQVYFSPTRKAVIQ